MIEFFLKQWLYNARGELFKEWIFLIDVTRLCRVLIAANVETQNLDVPSICDRLRDLMSFVQLKKRERHAWKSITFNY